MQGCWPARKPGHREIEAAPKEMHRAGLADKAAAEKLEDAIGLHEGAPEAMRCPGIVTGMAAIRRKTYRVCHLVWHFIDGDRDPNPAQQVERAAIKLGDGLGLERKAVFV